MSTVHNEAKKQDIAKIVLMPGDPLRAKFFTENYLTKYKQVQNVRGMNAFTGFLKGTKIRVTVMPHGMGLESIGIYTYELYKFYDVETIIRFGTSGSYQLGVNLWDLVIADKAYTSSNYGKAFNNNTKYSEATKSLVEAAKKAAKKLDIHAPKKLHIGTVNSSMWFYQGKEVESVKDMQKKNILVAEMEGYALYSISKFLNREALVLLTVSDHIVTHESTTASERQQGLKDMFALLVETVKQHANKRTKST